MYKNYCKILKSIIRLAKKQSNMNYVKTSKNKSKAMWNVIKSNTVTVSKQEINVAKYLYPNDKNYKFLANNINQYLKNLISNDYPNCINQNLIKIWKTI